MFEYFRLCNSSFKEIEKGGTAEGQIKGEKGAGKTEEARRNRKDGKEAKSGEII